MRAAFLGSVLASSVLASSALASSFVACSGGGGGSTGGAAGAGGAGGGGGAGGDKAPPTPLPPLTSAEDTVTVTLVPTTPQAPQPTDNPSDVAVQQSLLSQGYGDHVEGPGDATVDLTFGGAPVPPPGPARKLVSRFVHLADLQLADDESPIRLCFFDTPTISGAYRPEEGHQCRILNAMVRTLNAYHAAHPVDFVLLGGDNADNAQKNEVDWVSRILSGDASVECDSGLDDDPVPGPNNDPKDAFVAEGLAVPWYWVNGNHDVLVQGNFRTSLYTESAVGSDAPGGTRDWSKPGGPITIEPVSPDPERLPLSRAALLGYLAQRGDAGIDAATAASGKAYYWFDVGATPLRIIVMDTAAETGGSEGVVHQSDVDAFLGPALDKAAADGKWVIVTSHHSGEHLTDGSSPGGETQADAVLKDPFRDLIGGTGNVLMHLAGHSHSHVVREIGPAAGAPYWEVETESLADFPSQTRVVELWDEDNGFVSIRMVALDYSTEGDPVAEEGRALAFTDFTSGWAGDGRGDPARRNVVLWAPAP